MTAPELKVEYTPRGFAVARGFDRYGNSYSVQDSSLAEEACIWLGGSADRAHLTQEQVAQLLPLLMRFVETGSIAP
jgi:hypothetical protein